jgi:hypothetical protein
MPAIHITLSPQRRDEELSVEKQGNALIFNGEYVDLETYSPERVQCQWIVGEPEIVDGDWSVTIILPHGPAAAEKTRFPDRIVATTDGLIDLPSFGPKVKPRLADSISKKIPLPQPRTFKDTTLRNFLADPAALDAFPDAKVQIANVIAYWSATETTLRVFLQSRFGDDQVAAAKLLDALQSEDALSSALRVSAAMTRSSKIIDEMASFLSLRGALRKHRNSFAHGAYFLSSDYPECILLAESDAYRKAIHAAPINIFSFEGYKMKITAWSAQDFHLANNAAIAMRNAAIQLISKFP